MKTTQNKMGRPVVVTDAVVRKLEEAFRDGLSVTEACFLSGIGRATFYDRLTADADFADKMERAKCWPTMAARRTVVEQIKAGNLSAAKWWLERKAPEEFATPSTDKNQQPNITLTPAQWEGIKKASEAAVEVISGHYS